MKSGHPAPSHPSDHHLKLIFFSSPTDCVWGEGGERERERERENQWSIAKCEIFFSPPILFDVMGLVLRRRNGTEKNTLLLLLCEQWLCPPILTMLCLHHVFTLLCLQHVLLCPFHPTEVCIRIASAMVAMARLNWIWQYNTISFASKFKLYKFLVTSILLYSCTKPKKSCRRFTDISTQFQRLNHMCHSKNNTT